MKLGNPLSVLIVISFLIASCQKEVDGNDPTTTSSYRVKSYTESVTSPAGNFSATFNLNYDNNGRITSIVSAASPGDKFVYSFPSNNRFSMDLYNAGSVSIHEDFYLNTASFVDSTFQYNDTQDTTTEKYTYNAGNQLVQLNEYDYSTTTGATLYNTTTYAYDVGGNLVQTEDSYGEVHMYEYYPNLSYTLPLVTGPVNANTNKKMNLVKKHTLTVNGAVEGSADYTYTFDDKNRISTEKAVVSDGSIVTKTYTYF